MTNTGAIAVTTMVRHSRIPHAAHYEHSAGGHDLEQWVIEYPSQPDYRLIRALGLPSDARYHSGHRALGTRRQRWTYTAIRPLSPGHCDMCMTEV